MDETTCRDTVDSLMDYLEGDLAADRRRAVDEHFASCPRCVEFLVSYRDTPNIIRRCSDQGLPEPVARRLNAVIKDK